MKKELIPGQAYTLKYNSEFSHAVGKNGFVEFSNLMNDEDRVEAIFVGCVPSGIYNSFRNIFVNKNDPDRLYMSFGTENTDYIT